ncbi:MAG: ATP-binding cassette domain-containing protein [Tannerella sp.]|nr:ATP-binding cassette domain-containing protein [Tannerella sp.]
MNEIDSQILRLSGISKYYRDGENNQNRVLRGVDMQVGKGEFVAVRGASGSGKTTLLSILGTLLLPDSGNYLFDGKEMNMPGVDHSVVRNRHIGFMFQSHRLLPQFTALENILLPVLAYRQKAGDEETDYAHRLMELTDVKGVAGQYPDTLSGGEAARIALCRALLMKPLLLLADEPTGQLDAGNAQKTALLLSEINQTLLTTIVMVTHSDEMATVAHRILTLKDGILT